ncbi:MAG: hypothetical protein HYY24_02150 [Verrucomicrobia bacterium]|nr:hypothetical protein [Verrucomicrobiota bacterium]
MKNLVRIFPIAKAMMFAGLIGALSGCAISAPAPVHRASVEGAHWASDPVSAEKPGIVTKIMLPPRQARMSIGMFMAGSQVERGDVPPLSIVKGAPPGPPTAVECAAITECDEREYEILVIAPDQAAGSAGHAVYCVVLWNKAGIDWHAQISFEVSWQGAQKPYGRVVYRNTKDDSCLFVENGSKEGSWKVAQQMKFGKGAPPKEYAAKARDLSSFPRYKSSQ